jgi:hypothetical protein
MGFYKHLFVFFCGVCSPLAFSQPETKPSNETLLEAALCMNQDQQHQKNETTMKALMWLEKNGQQNAETGVFNITEPIKSGNLCLKNIALGGAFGVFMSNSQVCGGTAVEFEEFIRKQYPVLRSAKLGVDDVVAPEKDNEIVLASQVGRTKYSFAIGAWEFNPRGFIFTPSSKIRTFTCMYSSGSHN